MNLLCGFLAILINDPIWSFYLVLIGIAFDFVDGFSARMLKVPSLFGKELDSLADMVSFGVVPGFLYYHHVLADDSGPSLQFSLKLFVATLIPVLAALRLAKFNVNDSGKIGFEGLPSSAAALAIISIPFIIAQEKRAGNISEITSSFLNSDWLMLLVPFLLALLMVSKLPLFNFKSFKGGLKSNWVQLLYVTSSILLIIIFKENIWHCIPLSIAWYVLLSLITIPFWRKKFD